LFLILYKFKSIIITNIYSAIGFNFDSNSIAYELLSEVLFLICLLFNIELMLIFQKQIRAIYELEILVKIKTFMLRQLSGQYFVLLLSLFYFKEA